MRSRARSSGGATLRLLATTAAGCLFLSPRLAMPLAAQEALIEARVEGIAGSDLYLSAGADAGVRQGAVLVVIGEDGAASAGRLQVIEATSARSRVTFAGDPFPVTRGATLRLRILAGAEGAPAVEVAPGVAIDAEGGRPVRSRATARSAGSRTPRVRGSLGLSFDYRETVTSWDEFDYEERDRNFSTPAASLRLGVTDLPGGVEFRTSLRASYRASTDDVVQPQDLVRVYSLQVAKDFGAVQASVGRIYNPYEPMSGYFDGAWVHVGRREGFGAGVAAGLRPSREDAGISDSFPKLSVFANYGHRTGPLKYEGAASFTYEAANVPIPDIPGYRAPEDHLYFGLTQTLRTGRLLLRQSMAVDRDPSDDAWKVSRFLIGASVPIAGGLSAQLGYSLRQPYRVERPDPITYRRDRVNAGLTYVLGRTTVGADVSMNDPKDDVRGTGWTYSGWFQAPETSRLGLAFTGTVSVRDRDGDRLLYVMPGLARRFGSTFARAAYTFYRTEEPAATFSTHMGDLSVDFPIAARLRGTLAGRIQRGDRLDGTGIYGSVWWAF
jgi:hypothetical protein